ncbi:MAG: radical SAM protein [Candidatus Omnitrophica bacterium]|nr:radical SAM protein [Candidatus Omnitrophota bacterium]
MQENKAADVVLVYPKTGMDFGSTVAVPHSLLTIAAPLQKGGYKVSIIDQRVDKDWGRNLTEALKSGPVCVGISSMTGTQIHFAIEAAKVVRRAAGGKVPIVWGGPHPSILPEQTLMSEYVDIVCVGEGDVTFRELVGALASGGSLSGIEGIAYKDGGRAVRNPDRALIDVEGLLPVPWGLIDVEKYIHPDMYLKESLRTLDIGQTSRGCPFNCGFCSSASLRKRKWRDMSVEKSLGIIVDTVKRFGLSGIWIRDDEFYINRERAQRICEGIIRNDLKIHWYTSGTRVDVFNKASDEQTALLKKSGAYVLKFGAESGSDRVLELSNKGIKVEDTIRANLKAKAAGITPAFALMIGFPGETFEDIDKTIDLSFRLKRDNPNALFETMAIYTALPATPMYESALKNGLKAPRQLEGWIDWIYDDYDLEGRKNPWFDRKDRIRLGNISYMSILANAVPNVINSIRNAFLRAVLKIAYVPISRYYRFRLKNKYYTFFGDLAIIKYLRNKIFYKSDRRSFNEDNLTCIDLE